MPTTEPLRTGKTLIDFSGNDDFSYSARPTVGSAWIVGLTSNGRSDDYALALLGDDGQLNYDYSEDGVGRVPQLGRFEDNGGLAGGPYGDILTSGVSEEGGAYTLNILSTRSWLSGPPAEWGAVVLPMGTSAPFYSNVQTQGNSAVLASARSDSALTVAYFDSVGALYPFFGDSPVATLTLPQGLAFDGATPLALEPGGQIVVAGYSEAGASADFSVVRFNASGTRDTNFGANGTATYAIGPGDDFARAVTVQDDGKILIVGTSETSRGDYDLSVIRLNADGSLDTGFGNGGKVTVDFEGGRDAAQTVEVRRNGDILVTGSAVNAQGNTDIAAVQFTADGLLDTAFGDPADGLHRITGSHSENLLVGTASAELLSGQGGEDLLDGGAGRDRLRGGEGQDVFRFSERGDSYRTANERFGDGIVDFDPTQDVIDLTALGFTGLGDGRENTLAVSVNASGTRTYLKSFEADANGQRFEVALEGDLSGQLNETNIGFVPAILEGNDGKQRIEATHLASEVLGYGGDDKLIGGFGNDTLEGGAGRDVLNGRTGTDTFRYTELTDSYRDAGQTYSDRILEFEVYVDRIDVAALGFTGLGDGHNGTLAISVGESNLFQSVDTYLKSYDTNTAGQRFQLTLNGDLSRVLTEENFVFAPAPANDVELLGVAETAA
ncbi:M10 family metallopeptidase C-terminal domain-containing protein [Pseudomonas sp. Marseille-Q5115]|uniref:M10 family metallopeptidase C-terminal domain-containing protein n=1 Tax=Pseudomonas sp. Marseille-Q5115 TaxID=2866593 RepID=UPI001CE3B785|nr:hypothetical protein [Pseudomonas sp. Marseille-Q5115]